MKTVEFEDAGLEGRPALHALIVGVGGYPHLPVGPDDPPTPESTRTRLGLSQLKSPVRSARALAGRLIELGTERDPEKPKLNTRLGSVRLLLSPTAAELANEPALAQYACANLPNLRGAAYEWRERASRHADSVTLFYFAGHGVQRGRGDHVLLLHDFGRGAGPLLESSLEVDNLIAGMRPSAARRKIARRQLTLLDACRAEPAIFSTHEHLQAGLLWDVERSDESAACPVFHSTQPGALAHGTEEKSFFCQALLECLEGGAAVPAGVRRLGLPLEWRLTCESLLTKLKSAVQRISRENGRSQRVVAQHWDIDWDILSFPRPPIVRVFFELKPRGARDCTSFGLSNGTDSLSLEPPFAWGEAREIPGGEYRVDVRTDPVRYVAPPQATLTVHPPEERVPVDLRTVAAHAPPAEPDSSARRT